MLSSRTVFSFSDLTLEIGGNVYTAEYLADITISKVVDGKGTKGVSTSQISGKVFTSYKFPENSTVIVRYAGWEFPTYYTSEPEFDGTAMSFTAYDRCKDLDIPFDYSNYPEYVKEASDDNTESSAENDNSDSSSSNSTSSSTTTDSSSTSTTVTTTSEKKKKVEAKYLASQIVQDIANQVGFSGCDYVPRTTYLKNKDLKGKSCREIIQTLTEASFGVAYCGNDNNLKFISALSSGSGASVKSGEYSKIIEKSHKSYTKLLIEDTKNNKLYEYGGGDYSHCLMLSGSLLDEETSQAIASELLASNGLEYLAFSIENAIISSNLEIMGQIFIPDNETKYICRNITISFTATRAVASLSSPQMSESKAEYLNKFMRLSNDKVKLDTTYNTFFVNKNGSGRRLKI